jgi:photosystem II stability/assembly factor-like uncharacterized protein
MKKALTILFSFLLLTSIYSQWTAVTSPTTDRLYAISVGVVNPQVMWACGTGGATCRSTDAGTTWELKTSTGSSMYNYALEAIDENVCYIAATVDGSIDFRIFKTIDGGTTWTEQYANAASFSDAIRFWDANNGIAYGDPEPADYFVILKTSDGGANWRRIESSKIPAAISASTEFGVTGNLVINGNHVWFGTASDAGGFAPRMFHSTDYGETWTASAQITGLTGYAFGLDFRDELHGFTSTLNGDGAWTEDGGVTWNVVTIDMNYGFRNLKYIPGTNSIIAVGGISGKGGTSISYDDGKTWNTIEPTVNRRHRGVAVTSLTNAIAVGDNGVIWKWSGSNLPVELTSFTADMINGKVNLRWTTATEMNNAGFEIERKSDNGEWRLVAYKQGKGTTSDQNSYNYSDDVSKLNAKEITYRLKQIDFGGAYTYSTEVKINNVIPAKYEMSQNYPNPFNPATVIKYGLPAESNVTLTVYNSIGELVTELVSSVQQAGYYEVPFNASNLTTGTYFYSIKAQPIDGKEGFNTVKKMLLVK